jgi:DNA-directed RNA polymerase subunit RPC12/RpoP
MPEDAFARFRRLRGIAPPVSVPEQAQQKEGEAACPQCGETQTPHPEALPDGSTVFRCARCGGIVDRVPF